jgi:predicted alpha/beta-hydrolase family hydrolase
MSGSPVAGSGAEPVSRAGSPAVRGFLHRPAGPAADALVLAHGAGSDCRAPLLVVLAEAFCARGLVVLRCDLPYRQASPAGPPSPATAAADRDGLRRALAVARGEVPGRLFLGGHSYGGRQASMLAADEPELAAALLLLAYPLHPPRRAATARTAHFPDLRTPAFFVHGSRDPFGTLAELRAALTAIPARTVLRAIEGGDHALLRGPAAARRDLVDAVASAFLDFSRSSPLERDFSVQPV